MQNFSKCQDCHLLTLTLRSPGGCVPCPSASVFCGAGCLVFVVLLPSELRGLGREQSPGAHHWRLPSRHSLTAVLCPTSLWFAVVCLSLPLSALFPISLLVMVPLVPPPSFSYPPDSLAPSSLPLRPSYPLDLLSYVSGQGHSHRGFSSSVAWAMVRVMPRAWSLGVTQSFPALDSSRLQTDWNLPLGRTLP